jgi:poly(3-hydroxybutyrate) depolymerase
MLRSLAPSLCATALLTQLMALAVPACQPTAGDGTTPSGTGGSSSSAGTGGTRSSSSGSGGSPAAGIGGSSSTAGTGGSNSSGGTGGSTSSPGTGGGGTSEPGTGGVGDAGTTPPDTGSGDPGPSVPAGPKTSEACGKDLPMPAEGYHDIQVGDLKRRFILRVPSTYDGKKAWPLVFAFHGAGNQTAATFDKGFAFRPENEEKTIMIFGESLSSGGSNTWMTLSQHPANMAYIDALIDWSKKNLCMDPTRIFSTGQSSGGYFSQTLACQKGDVIRAVASNSGGERYFENCKGNPGVMLSYGKGDEASHTTAAAKATKFWIERKGCKPDAPMPVDPSPCVSYTGCKDDIPFVLCAHPGGHPLPAYAPKGFWNFFDSFK